MSLFALDAALTERPRVLLVDDSPFFRNLLTPLLNVAGYQVTTAENPAQALRLQEDGIDFDVIVSDIEMPGMNGFDLARALGVRPCWLAFGDLPDLWTFVGAGAIGGFMAAKLEMAGTPVTVVARGPHGDALRTKGLTLLSEGQESVTRPRVATDPKKIGPQDYLVLTLKAHSLLPAMAQLEPLIGPDTTIVAAINGAA